MALREPILAAHQPIQPPREDTDAKGGEDHMLIIFLPPPDLT